MLNFSSLFIFQDRVKKWMDYTWSQQKSFDEHAMLSYLPLKMRTDIAMRVHYSTLGKVKLFRNCEPGLLKDLVVLLRPVIYLPGDYICRKNDIGKEMFIIQSGQVQVKVFLFKNLMLISLKFKICFSYLLDIPTKQKSYIVSGSCHNFQNFFIYIFFHSQSKT